MSQDAPETIVVPPIIPRAGATLPYRVPEGLEIPPGWSNVDVFTLAPNQLRRFLIIVVSINLAIGILGGAAFGAALFYFTPDATFFERAVTGGLVFATMLGFQAFAAFRSVIKTRREWPAYRLLVADQGFVQSGEGRPTILASTADIQTIVEELDAFRVSLGRTRFIRLPKRIDRADLLRERLARQWGLGKRESAATLVLNIASSYGVMILLVAAIIIAGHTSRTSVVCACLVASVVGATISAWRMFRIADATIWMRIMGWAILASPLLIVPHLLRVLLP